MWVPSYADMNLPSDSNQTLLFAMRHHQTTTPQRRARGTAAAFVRFPLHGITLACLATGVTGSALKLPVAGAALRPLAVASAPAEVAAALATRPAPAAAPQAAPAAAIAPAATQPAAADSESAAPEAPPAPALLGEPPPEEVTLPRALAVSMTTAGAGASDNQLRAQLHWLPVRVGAHQLATLDVASRLALARAAAERAGLATVGLDFRDLYGVINAETSWLPRTGMGRNGVASHGLAQLEPATARALGVRNPDDAVEAVHAAATLLRQAAVWSARRIAGLQLDATERARRLRAGVSVYYNLSTRARERWNGSDDSALPIETLRHIRNVRAGALEAEALQSGQRGIDLQALAAAVPALAPQPLVRAVLAASEPRPLARAVAVPKTTVARAATPRPLGTIAWASRPGEQHVVWSNGSVTRSTDPASGRTRVHWTSGSNAG